MVENLIGLIREGKGNMEFFNLLFWQNFVSNALATIIGVIIGIPVAIWISRYLEKSSEKERKNKILGLLREELFGNLSVLGSWNKNDRQKKNLEIRSLGMVLKTESWMAFSDGGELEWIKDPSLLSDLSDAYYHIRLIQQLCERYLDVIQFGGNNVSAATVTHYESLIDKIIDGGVNSIESVLKKIS